MLHSSKEKRSNFSGKRHFGITQNCLEGVRYIHVKTGDSCKFMLLKSRISLYMFAQKGAEVFGFWRWKHYFFPRLLLRMAKLRTINETLIFFRHDLVIKGGLVENY